MSARAHIKRLDAAIARAGDTVVLQRVAADASGVVTVTAAASCPAWVRAVHPQDIAEPGVREHRVVLSATSLGVFGVPDRDDRILIEGTESNITEIEPIRYAGSLVRVNLLCRG